MNDNSLLSEEIKNRWAPVINEEALPEIRNPTVRNITIRLLENTAKELKEASGTSTGAIANYDPVLISMIRRTMPSLIAHDIVGVQPMSGPTGLIFAMKAYYGGSSSGTEAFTTTEPDATHAAKTATADGEVLGTDSKVAGGSGDPVDDPVVKINPWPEMSFAIEKSSVTAQTRALKAKYTTELAHDLKTIHGLDAETELANILSGELVAEINREIIADIADQAIPITIAQDGVTADGIFNLDSDTDGRWEVEMLKGLMIFINKQAGKIGLQTRRGVGNFIITSANVAGALDMVGKVDTSTVNNDLAWTQTGVTFVGILNGRYKMYVDPYLATDLVIMGFKGSHVYDAGIFYAPYVPLQMFKATGEDDFQPRMGFKTRYGMAYNPFVPGTSGTNVYYRAFTVAGL